MCCVVTTILLLGPRLGIAFWYIVQPVRWQAAFTSWIWPALGFIFAPWLTLMYVVVAPGGILGLDWLWLGLALAADIATYGGGAYSNQQRGTAG
jgi:hypothetical protein